MFSVSAPLTAPPLSHGQVIKKINNHEITKVRVVPGSSVSLYETKDEKVGQAKIIASDYFFEKAVAIIGYLLGVNPFNQPGVEAYKNKMFELLGRK